MMKPSARAILAAWLVGLAICIAFWVGAVYVAIHFIHKFW